MRVLRISHSGNVSAYRERERALHATGRVEVALVCPSDWPHLGQSDTHIEEEFPTWQAKTYGTGSVPLFGYELQPIIRAIRNFKPDIVDIHEEPYSVSGFQCLALSKMYAPRAAYVFYSAQNINKRYPIPFRQTEQYAYRSCHGAYPCSEGVQQVLMEKGFKKACPVIPLGVNTTVFSPTGPLLRPWRLEGTHVIGFTGRLVESKGLAVVLHALSDLRSAIGTEGDVRILVAGVGPDLSKFKALATEIGVADKVEWLGEIKQADMPSFYRSCSTVVVPSLTTKTWKEQFGRVPVESMSCGTPVISSDSGSLPEVIEGAGMIVHEGDRAELVQALLTMLRQEETRKAFEAQGLKRVADKYSWRSVADAMLDLYDTALGLKQNETHK